MSAKPPAVRSMTGFSRSEGLAAGSRLRVEIRTLNHRFLDLKIRLPREFSAAEMQLRQAVQGRLSRGAVDLKVDRSADPSAPSDQIRANLPRAAQYHEALVTLQKSLGLSDPIRTIDIAAFPDVLGQQEAQLSPEEAWPALEPLLLLALERLDEARRSEGAALGKFLATSVEDLGGHASRVRARRAECESEAKARTAERVKAVFEAHPIATASVQAVLESRIAQELSLLLDRTDVEEELTRLEGHLDQFRKALDGGGQLGRKLEFILQEMHREVNTLGNKAQDLGISDQIVQMKVRLEQMREQVMNLE